MTVRKHGIQRLFQMLKHWTIHKNLTKHDIVLPVIETNINFCINWNFGRIYTDHITMVTYCYKSKHHKINHIKVTKSYTYIQGILKNKNIILYTMIYYNYRYTETFVQILGHWLLRFIFACLTNLTKIWSYIKKDFSFTRIIVIY